MVSRPLRPKWAIPHPIISQNMRFKQRKKNCEVSLWKADYKARHNWPKYPRSFLNSNQIKLALCESRHFTKNYPSVDLISPHNPKIGFGKIEIGNIFLWKVAKIPISLISKDLPFLCSSSSSALLQDGRQQPLPRDPREGKTFHRPSSSRTSLPRHSGIIPHNFCSF